MNKLLSICAAALLVASTTGCGCCFGRKTQTVAMPAVPACAPACQPCTPTCDPCCNNGGYYGSEMYTQPTIAQ